MLKDGPKPLSELQKEIGAAFGPAMGLARKNNWINVSGEKISVENPPKELPGEKALNSNCWR